VDENAIRPPAEGLVSGAGVIVGDDLDVGVAVSVAGGEGVNVAVEIGVGTASSVARAAATVAFALASAAAKAASVRTGATSAINSGAVVTRMLEESGAEVSAGGVAARHPPHTSSSEMAARKGAAWVSARTAASKTPRQRPARMPARGDEASASPPCWKALYDTPAKGSQCGGCLGRTMSVRCGQTRRCRVAQTAQSKPSLRRHQFDDPRLLEVMIGRERLPAMLQHHHDEADTIGQTPVFVGTPLVERPALNEQLLAGRNDLQDRQLPQAIHVRRRVRAEGRRREGISYLEEHELGRHQARLALGEHPPDLPRLFVQRVIGVQERDPGCRVHKDPGLRHGSPRFRLAIQIMIVLVRQVADAGLNCVRLCQPLKIIPVRLVGGRRDGTGCDVGDFVQKNDDDILPVPRCNRPRQTNNVVLIDPSYR